MSIQQRQASWIAAHGTEAQARRSSIYLARPSKVTNAALALLFTKVCEGR